MGLQLIYFVILLTLAAIYSVRSNSIYTEQTQSILNKLLNEQSFDGRVLLVNKLIEISKDSLFDNDVISLSKYAEGNEFLNTFSKVGCLIPQAYILSNFMDSYESKPCLKFRKKHSNLQSRLRKVGRLNDFDLNHYGALFDLAKEILFESLHIERRTLDILVVEPNKRSKENAVTLQKRNRINELELPSTSRMLYNDNRDIDSLERGTAVSVPDSQRNTTSNEEQLDFEIKVITGKQFAQNNFAVVINPDSSLLLIQKGNNRNNFSVNQPAQHDRRIPLNSSRRFYERIVLRVGYSEQPGIHGGLIDRSTLFNVRDTDGIWSLRRVSTTLPIVGRRSRLVYAGFMLTSVLMLAAISAVVIILASRM